MAKILLVDDELALREVLQFNLERLCHEVVVATTGQEAVQLAHGERPDLIILDVMLPGIDGFEVCRTLRKDMMTPILMLTARTEEADIVIGLELGADDYLTKPFQLRELQARVKALLRRAAVGQAPAASPPEDDVQCDGLTLSTARHRVSLHGEEIALRPKEFDLLAFFMRHPGLALSRERLMDAVWGENYVGDLRTIDVHVRWLREKIEDAPSHPTRIETIRNVGYRFNG